MAENADIGSKAWFTDQANKLLDFGLGVLGTKLIGDKTYPTSSGAGEAVRSPEGSGLTRWIPYAIGGVVAVGIFFLLSKR